MTLTRTLRSLWRQLPENVRRRLWYATNRITHYTELHPIAYFAGNLEQVKVAYATSRTEDKVNLSRQFDSIVHELNMANGVAKTTYFNRLGNSLSTVLSTVQLPHSAIRVLDLPSSSGISSLQSLALLRERYRVTSYVLGDRYHRLLYDPRHSCIFDEQGNLLQVGFRRLFYTLGRVTFPHNVIARYLRKRYRFERGNIYQQLLAVHPEVERALGEGVFRLEEMDIFQPISGRYDFIISFNLLQRSYFPPDAIETGMKNLTASLSEGGLLMIGNEWESFRVLQKQDGFMISRMVISKTLSTPPPLDERPAITEAA